MHKCLEVLTFVAKCKVSGGVVSGGVVSKGVAPLSPNSKLKTQNSKLKTQNSKLKTQNSKLKTIPYPLKPMLTSAIVAYFHYFSFLLATAALMVETLTLKANLERSEAWRIVIADALYGIAAIGVLGTGILRVLYFGQGSDFYAQNPVFWIKVGLYILIGALSLYPTVSFLLWIPGLQKEEIPQPNPQRITQLQWIIRSELAGFAIIPLFAALMARGIGL